MRRDDDFTSTVDAAAAFEAHRGRGSDYDERDDLPSAGDLAEDDAMYAAVGKAREAVVTEALDRNPASSELGREQA